MTEFTALPFHPLANLFPLIEGAEFEALTEDIRVHGVREPIILLDDQILDGRNRYRAMLRLAETGATLGAGWRLDAGQTFLAELDPETSLCFEDYSRPAYGDPLAFVLSKNLTRRHLTESQRAMIAAAIATMRQGERTDVATAEPSANLPKVSQAQAAELLNVSERSLRSARQVTEQAAPELMDAVRRGDMSVSAAAVVAELPAAEQAEIVAALPRDEAGRLTPAAKRALAPVIREIRAEKQAEKATRREIRERTLAEEQQALPDKRYGVILADPEWRFEVFSRDSGMDRAADNHYPTSETDDICSRNVGSIAADDCVLFLWATAPMIRDALAVMEAWGFSYKSMAVWRKDRLGTGYWFRNAHELLLVGTRGDVPAPAMGTQFASVFDAPVGAHSAKPDWQYELIERYFPRLPKIELNARRARPGWDAWGYEAPEKGDRPSCATPADSTAVPMTDSAGAAVTAAANPPAGLTRTIPTTPMITNSPAASAPASSATAPDSNAADLTEIPAFLRRAPANAEAAP